MCGVVFHCVFVVCVVCLCACLVLVGLLVSYVFNVLYCVAEVGVLLISI